MSDHEKKRETEVVIHFMRHAQSCANIISRYKPWYEQWKRYLIHDPPLSSFGIRSAMDVQIRHYRRLYSGVHIVLTSCLLRAIQTACYVFPDDVMIFPAPFLVEHGTGLENTIRQLKYQVNVLTPSQKRRVDYRFVVEKKGTNFYFSKEAGQVHFRKFLEWLTLHLDVLKELAQEKKQHSKTKTFHLAVVSHGHVMGRNLHIPDPYNLGMIKQKYHWQHVGNHFTLDLIPRKTDAMNFEGVKHPPHEHMKKTKGSIGCMFQVHDD